MTRRAITAACSWVLPLLLAAGVSACSSSGAAGSASPTARVAGAATADCPQSAGHDVALPGVTLPCLGGGMPVRLDGLGALPAIVNVWASWCLPCQREVPALQSVYAAAQGRVHVLGVDIEDTDGSALDFAKHVGMHYPSVVDRDGQVLRRLGFAGPPATVLIDRDGSVVYRHAGQLSEAELKDQVRRHLGVAL